MRFELFKETLEQIKEHNRKYAAGKVDVAAFPNEFSDLTDDEKRKLLESEQ
jgi:autonomous glycyl radical cofactor GrcA